MQIKKQGKVHSKSRIHPNGIGNAFGVIDRYFTEQFRFHVTAFMPPRKKWHKLSSLCRIHQTFSEKKPGLERDHFRREGAGLFRRTLTRGTSWTAYATMLFIVSGHRHAT
ncbi:MAG: hypothetical protein ACKVX9_21630 [Blastocatellia bacterium]